MLHSLGSKARKLLLAATPVLALAACTSMPVSESVDADPWEPFNRGMYQVNYAIDGVVLKPVTQLYRASVPERGQTMVHNFVENLGTPVTFGNSLLQADPENTFVSLWRFMLNSSVGVGGLFDVASEVGLKGRKADFGQTLALYGVESGPYLFLPVMGPSGVRDGFGLVGDVFMHPASYVEPTVTQVALGATMALDKRSEYYNVIEDIERSSLDPYVTFRSGYIQKRANDIKKARIDRTNAWQKAGFVTK